jgi:hypothetical protein
VRDWKAIARGLGLAEAAADPVAAPLEALERDFRPLVESLTMEIEPALAFRPGDDE